MIVVVDDGEAANGPNLSSGSTLYEPEQNVLAFGRWFGSTTGASASGGVLEGTSKSMRKMKDGDSLRFITITTSATVQERDSIVARREYKHS